MNVSVLEYFPWIGLLVSGNILEMNGLLGFSVASLFVYWIVSFSKEENKVQREDETGGKV